MEIEIINVPDHNRYEITVDGKTAGYSAYRVRPEALVFTHTEVQPEFEGKGVGSALAKGVLDDVRASGGVIIPMCPFIAAYIRHHPEYRDLIAPDYLPEFDAIAAS